MYFLFPFMLIFSLPNILMALAAVIPAIWLLVKVYRLDKIEKEPKGLIVRLIGMGMLATVGAILTETIGSALINESTVLGKFLMYFIVVALSEEGFKFLFLKRATWRNPDYNYQFDGIVYAVSVSLGFALLENLSYVFSYGFSVAVVRAVTAVPGHACFGVFMGVWYGLAKMYANQGDVANEKKCLRMALLIPVLLHGAYDFIASLEGDYSWILFILFVIGLFFYTNRLLKRQSASDVRIG